MRATSPVEQLASAYLHLRPEFRRPCRQCAWDGREVRDMRLCRPAETCRGIMVVVALALARIASAEKAA